MRRELSYRCGVCGWQGASEPFDFGETIPCPQCGVYLEPMSWARTWGVALLLAAGAVLVVLAAAWLRRG